VRLVVQFGCDAKTDVPAAVVEGFRHGKLMLMFHGGAAALIDSSDPKALSNRARRVSCFLPLPIKPDLPISINGHFALQYESRSNLCMTTSAAERSRGTALS
jgi:sacsin